jgi:hypothetical protein
MAMVLSGVALESEGLGGENLSARNGSRDGPTASLAFRSMTCPFLYTVKIKLSPTDF